MARVPTKKRPRKRAPTVRVPRQQRPRGGSVASGEGAAVGTLGPSTVRVRMYRVGFGDCFLISLPSNGRSRGGDTHAHVLVDCGVHSRGDIGTLGDVVDDIAAVTGRKLAIVVATHAHQDHIAGFDRFADLFGTFDIDQVWLPWTWDPHDRRAVRLQRKQAALAGQLEAHFAALAARGGARTRTQEAAAAAIANVSGNGHAMTVLRSGFGVGAKVRYLRAADALGARQTGVTGLTARLLGPPDSEAFLAQMDPPAGQRYLRLGARGAAEAAEVLRPFADRWRIPRSAHELDAARLTAQDEQQFRRATAAPLEELAFALDQARNNESVVSLFVYRDQYLLFPGDAQYGNWRWWLEHENAADILSRVRFFKVAHHGSVNATPMNALEGMRDGGFAAMVSTQSVPWDSIPREPLMARLAAKTKRRVVRSDWLALPGAPRPLSNAEPRQPRRLPAGFRSGPLWFDYVIDV